MTKTKWRVIALFVLLFAATIGVTVLMRHCDPAGRYRAAEPNDDAPGGIRILPADATPDVPAAFVYGTVDPAVIPTEDDPQSPTGTRTTPSGTAEPKGNTLYWKNRKWLISNDASEEGLKFGPAFQPGADDPEADRLCVVLGHNTDRQLAQFIEAKKGDEVELWFDGNLYLYEVTTIITYANEYDLIYPETAERMLIIVTCYKDTETQEGKLVLYCKPMED